uniref:Uncharacterized protein n=1 Tax=Nelumbo nucifera TaxID=4432 RepID=A0A822XJ30_NELNU|nr:TPA_asm: hypothetical protein HUJ06_020238 [Nelumbo nucifera]
MDYPHRKRWCFAERGMCTPSGFGCNQIKFRWVPEKKTEPNQLQPNYFHRGVDLSSSEQNESVDLSSGGFQRREREEEGKMYRDQRKFSEVFKRCIH